MSTVHYSYAPPVVIEFFLFFNSFLATSVIRCFFKSHIQLDTTNKLNICWIYVCATITHYLSPAQGDREEFSYGGLPVFHFVKGPSQLMLVGSVIIFNIIVIVSVSFLCRIVHSDNGIAARERGRRDGVSCRGDLCLDAKLSQLCLARHGGMYAAE